MNLFSPVSEIMSTRLITVSPEDNLLTVKEIFDSYRIHHLPVVLGGKLTGMISKNDFMHFTGGLSHHQDDRFLVHSHLENTHAKEIMTTRLAKIEATDRINVAIEIFNQNIFHALPVVDGEELVGIVTTFDIIRSLADDRPQHPEEVYTKALHEI